MRKNLLLVAVLAAALLLTACGTGGPKLRNVSGASPLPAATVTVAPAPTVTVTATPTPTPTVTVPRTVVVAPSETVCGNAYGYRVSVEGTTSCPFAMNVAEAYATYGGPSVQAWSPVTLKWYDMHCTGYPVYCTGGIQARIHLR